MNSLADSNVGAASAKITRHGLVDIGVTWLGVLLQQRLSRHQLPGLAIATLGDILLYPNLLQSAQGAGFSEAFDCRNCSICNR
jgi:hypothetical protein